MEHFLLAIDQGTTTSRAILFNQRGKIISHHEMMLSQYYPREGWVEQDPEEMFQHTITCCREALRKAALSPQAIAAVGLSNQRETTIVWDKETGKAIYPAIVWQDRRTSDFCQTLSRSSWQEILYQKTGLLLDPYFSATKLIWILDHVPFARERALRNELLFGTVDTFLLWKLTHGQSHTTDATNASRTLLFDIHRQEWDATILQEWNIPPSLLPKVFDNAAFFGEMDESLLGKKIPITGMAGDQQAAAIGQACFHSGMVKATYGTGGFVLLNTGSQIIPSQHRLLSTVLYRLNGQVTYGLEGSIFATGTTIKWLRDKLELISHAAETESLANSVPNTEGVYLVPAFTGLGAPYWRPDARGALLGLTRNSSRAHIVRAALENVAYQTRDLLDAMMADAKTPIHTLRVDGGMANNTWLLQFLADMLHVEVQRPHCIETTALGAAYLAGLYVGFYSSLEDIAENWQIQTKFLPQLSHDESDFLYRGWKEAVNRVIG